MRIFHIFTLLFYTLRCCLSPRDMQMTADIMSRGSCIVTRIILTSLRALCSPFLYFFLLSFPLSVSTPESTSIPFQILQLEINDGHITLLDRRMAMRAGVASEGLLCSSSTLGGCDEISGACRTSHRRCSDLIRGKGHCNF